MNWITKAVFFLDPIDDDDDDDDGDDDGDDDDDDDDDDDEKTNKSTRNKSRPDWCICRNIWKHFGNVFKCGCCTCCTHCRNKDNEHGCLAKTCYFCSECHCGDNGDNDLKDKKLPHEHQLKLRKKHGKWYFGFMKLNMNRIGIYLLLCGCIWCASVAFFQAVILSYESVSNGNTDCPTPKYGTSATVVDCFIFANTFEASPINKTSSIQCNGTTQLSFSGFRAACFAWIYDDVEVTDVIEELGICAGIIAMLGTVVIILYYLCRDHRWRFFFDILASLAVAAIPVLLYRKGNVAFIAYILLGTLCGTIIITEYLLKYVPLCTWLCLLNGAYQRIFKPNTQSTGKPNTQSTGKPNTQSTGKPNTQSTGKPNTQSKVKPFNSKNP